MKRNEFNNLLKNEYGNKEPVFDLAKIESNYPDGRRSFFERDRTKYDVMLSEYTDDGGHLKNAGRKMAAEQFLIFLATLSNK